MDGRTTSAAITTGIHYPTYNSTLNWSLPSLSNQLPRFPNGQYSFNQQCTTVISNRLGQHQFLYTSIPLPCFELRRVCARMCWLDTTHMLSPRDVTSSSMWQIALCAHILVVYKSPQGQVVFNSERWDQSPLNYEFNCTRTFKPTCCYIEL